MKFLNDVGSAVVLRMEGELVVVEDEDGLNVLWNGESSLPRWNLRWRRTNTETPFLTLPPFWPKMSEKSACVNCKRNLRSDTKIHRRRAWPDGMHTWKWTSTFTNWWTTNAACRIAPNWPFRWITLTA